MLRLVTSNNIEIFRHLRGRTVDRLAVDYTVGSSSEELLLLVRQQRPQVALFDLELSGGSGYDLSRAIKSDAALGGTHVILLVQSALTRADLARVEESRCDDILALPIHSDDFCHHLAHVAGVPFRHSPRVGVALEVSLSSAEPPVTGQVINVAPGGLCIQLPRPEIGPEIEPEIEPENEPEIEKGQVLRLVLHHGGQSYPGTQVTVVWSKLVTSASGGMDNQLGCSFSGPMPEATRQLVAQLALFDIMPAPPDGDMSGGVTVSLQGDFTELTDFSPLAKRLASESRIDFNLAGVRYVSSAGVRAWCEFLATLKNKMYGFRHCSLAFASQAAMVPMVIGHGQLQSLEAPYHCERCEREELRLLEVKSVARDDGLIEPPRLRCKSCGSELVFDDIPERYFAFLAVPG